jgi:hypothetical protein
VPSNYIEQAIMVDLKASTAVHDKVGDRIFWLQAEQNATLPYCTYSLVSDPHTSMMFDSSDTGQARVQINVVDDDRYNALACADAVRDRLDKYSSAMDSMTIYSLYCSGIIVFPLQEQDNVYRATFDALVRYKDA